MATSEQIPSLGKPMKKDGMRKDFAATTIVSENINSTSLYQVADKDLQLTSKHDLVIYFF